MTTNALPPPVPPNQTSPDVPADLAAEVRKAFQRQVLPPYVVTQDDPLDPHSRRLWTLQRATTPEGVEPGSWWPIYADPDGRQVAGPRGDK